MDGALKAVEKMTFALHYDFECFVVFVTTNFAAGHGKPPGNGFTEHENWLSDG